MVSTQGGFIKSRSRTQSAPHGANHVSAASKSGYRADVDGLRAIAILAVLLFHAFRGWVPGGFVGVDVFFVISGFLISGILFDELDRGSFTFRQFYARRVRRIFPALALVCVFCLALGWLVLLPSEYRQLGKHVLGGAGFVSNFVLFDESGYFDSDSAGKPLLHLWSLGVEEQYYLLWPLLLYWCRGRPRATFRLLTSIAAISFAASLYLTEAHAAAAFYLPVSRFWELMVGSALAYWPRYAGAHVGATRAGASTLRAFGRSLALPPDAAATLGLVAIGLSLLIINEHRLFPGLWALWVCAGAALLIAAGPDAWINKHLLASRPMVWIGLISYPLYLWHWPLLSFEHIVGLDASMGRRAAAVLLSVLLAWATYRTLEVPLRRRSATRPKMQRAVIGLVASMSVVGLVGGLTWYAVIPAASAADPRLEEISEAMTDWEYRGDPSVPGDVPNTILFIGDSHMMQFWPRIELDSRAHAFPRRSIRFRTGAGCVPMLGIERQSRQCLRFVEKSLAIAEQPNVDVVVISAAWYDLRDWGDYYRADSPSHAAIDVLAPENQWLFDGFARTLAELRQRGKQVVVLLCSPGGRLWDPGSMVDRSYLPPRALPPQPVSRSALLASVGPIDDRIRRAAQAAGAEVIDPKDWFCSGTMCSALDAAGRPVMTDRSHLRASWVRAHFDGLDRFLVTGVVGLDRERAPATIASPQRPADWPPPSAAAARAPLVGH